MGFMTALLWVFALALAEVFLLKGQLLSVVYSWTPAAVAAYFARREGVRFPVLGVPNRYLLLALFLPPLLMLLATLLALPLGEWQGLGALKEAFPKLKGMPDWAFLLFYLFAGLLLAMSVGLFYALGGEVFWRGYLWEKLRKEGFWPASLKIGALFGAWRALFLVAHSGFSPFPLLYHFLFGVFATPGLLFFRERGRSVLAAALFLSGLQAFGFLPRALVHSPEWAGGLAELAALALFNLLLRRWVR